ncbi:MAG: cytochrome b [Stappiaceae bacterium]
MSDTSVAYTGTARFFHWLTVLCVLTMIPAGLLMLRIGSGSLQNFLFDFHRSMGVVLFVITAFRLAYRITHKPAPLPADIPALQKGAAHLVHVILYGFLLINPLIGWIGTSAYGAAIKVFGLFTLPPIIAKDKAFATTVLEVHQVMGWIFTAAVVVHIAAALFHHFIKHDGILLRMTRGQT